MSLVHNHHERPFPRGALWFVAVMMTFTMMSAGAVRLGYAPVSASPVLLRQSEHLKPLVTRDISFADQADGGLKITDVGTRRVVKTIVPGEPSGFIRGIIRSMGRERRMHHIGPSAPFHLASWPDGELSLTDTYTGRVLELNSFGPDNRASFARLLK
jgi:putative photosynthetic complex assembly protein